MPEHTPPLPPRHVADRLLRQYYDHVHHVFPVLHWPTFQDEYAKVYEAGTIQCKPRTWGAVLFCVFSCGVIHSLDQGRFEDAKDYLMKGSSMIDVWQDVFHMDQAKAAFFASLVLSELNLKSASWVWLGSAVRISQDIGLHVETGPWPPIEGEMRKRLWYCIYAQDRYGTPHMLSFVEGEIDFGRLLALELGKPMLIDDADCDTEYPEPVDDQYITDQGIMSMGQPSTPLLATIHVVRSLQSLIKLFKSPSITTDTLVSREKYFDTCMSLFPPHLQLSSRTYLDPRSLAPIIYFQNARIVLHRHNLSPSCSIELRRQAIDNCVGVSSETTALLSRCMQPVSPHGASADASSDWSARLATSASTLLCTHIWRCTLFLLFRGEYSSALLCVRASSAIGTARLVNTSCGRNLAFFLRCLLEKLQRGETTELERDEEMMAYVSGDLQSSTDNSWVWSGSETGMNLVKDRHPPQVLGSTASPSSFPFQQVASSDLSSAAHTTILTEEEGRDWGGWEWIERHLQFLLEQQQQQQLRQARPQPISPTSHPQPNLPPTSQSSDHASLVDPTISKSLGTPVSPISNSSRMTIANII